MKNTKFKISQNKIQKQIKKMCVLLRVRLVCSSAELSSLLWFSELLQVPTVSEVEDLLLL